MTIIQVEINCDGEYCGNCGFLKWLVNPRCTLFGQYQQITGEVIRLTGKPIKRCPQCLQSEVKHD